MLICVCVNFHYSISFVGKLLFCNQNVILCNDTLGKSVILIYSTKYTWYKFFEEIEPFFGKGVNLVVNFGKKRHLVLEYLKK